MVEERPFVIEIGREILAMVDRNAKIWTCRRVWDCLNLSDFSTFGGFGVYTLDIYRKWLLGT